MATQKFTQPAPDRAIEALLAEIASTAYFTEARAATASAPEPEEMTFELARLRDTIARMGWMADVALKRLDSENCMYEGDAAAWLLPAGCFEVLAQGVQS